MGDFGMRARNGIFWDGKCGSRALGSSFFPGSSFPSLRREELPHASGASQNEGDLWIFPWNSGAFPHSQLLQPQGVGIWVGIGIGVGSIQDLHREALPCSESRQNFLPQKSQSAVGKMLFFPCFFFFLELKERHEY